MKRKLTLLLLIAVLISLTFGIVPAFADDVITAEVQEKPVMTSTLTYEEIPEYGGKNSIRINDGDPDFYIWQIKADPYIWLSPLDELGRTGAGMACIGPETLPVQPRGSIGDVKPSGWHTERYDDIIEDMYLYNRTHVLGYMLSSDNSTPENLFTGTRYLNATVMLPYENRVLDYIQTTGNHVLYRVTPIYNGKNLVASGVQIEALSVEDFGDRISLNVYLYNVQPGIIIDYATGNSKVDPDYGKEEESPVFALEATAEGNDTAETERKTAPQETPELEPQKAASTTVTYIGNANSHKFHYPSCGSVKKMKDSNKVYFYGSRDEVIAAGYSPCGNCHP